MDCLEVDTATTKRLNEINREFYRTTAQNFDESRGRFWPGWKRLLPYLTDLLAPVSALDVGCGNARFGRFLAKHLGRAVTYHGLDSSPALLARAGEDLSRLPGLTFRLEERDIVETPPDAGQYSLVTAFGLLHHVPGFQERRELVRALAERVAPGGVLAFTGWCFYEYERFRARIVPWPADLISERHDYLLDWRRGHAANTALRYCHYIDDAEHADLLAASDLLQVATFRADGHTGDINRYGVLRRT